MLFVYHSFILSRVLIYFRNEDLLAASTTTDRKNDGILEGTGMDAVLRRFFEDNKISWFILSFDIVVLLPLFPLLFVPAVGNRCIDVDKDDVVEANEVDFVNFPLIIAILVRDNDNGSTVFCVCGINGCEGVNLAGKDNRESSSYIVA